jgi:ornithine cyclodeaminase/alanine dehydrogenase-like protein (mu-crystallin family)
MAEVLVLTADEVRRLLRPHELADALRTALMALSDGTASVPPRGAATIGDGMLASMPGYVPGLGLAAKLVAYFRGNEALGVPSHQALVAVFDPATGTPLALMDGTYLTGVRTATSAAVAALALARPEPEVVAIVGAGVQGGEHLSAFATHLSPGRFRVASRNPENARRLADGHAGAEVADSFEAAVRGADVVCLCTDSDEPVVRREWLAPGTHVSSVGSGLEVDAATVRAAAVFVESRAVATSPFPAGSRELAGRDPETVTEVGEVLLGTRPGRRSTEELTLYKSMGHAVEDVAAATLVLRAATEQGLGRTISL